MFLDQAVGGLREPLTGRGWSRELVFHEYCRRVRHFQELGLRPADRAFLHYGNSLEFFVDLLAIWALGGCVVPIDQRLTAFEVETLARAATPRFSIWRGSPDNEIGPTVAALGVEVIETPPEGAGPAAPPEVPNGHLSLEAPALILFTSGTTGDPKGVVHTHRTLRARWLALRQSLGVERFRRTLCLLPTHFGHGLICNCLFPWLSGNDLYVAPPFRADMISQLGQLLDEEQITFMSSVPTLWRLALRTAAPPEAGTLQQVHCGSAPLSAEMWRDIQTWSGTSRVYNTYGITETGSWVAGTTVPDFEPEDGFIGEGWGAVVRILHTRDTDVPPPLAEVCAPGVEGHVWLNTAALMTGYFGRDDLTDQVVAQGWFLTGDIGLLDDRGLLYLRGREREEINKGGMKVHPGDVDSVIGRFAGVTDVCAFAYDEALYGQDVGVAIVVEDPSERWLVELYGWTRQHLAEHKVPTRWYLVEEIPRTSRGKINRSVVAQECSELEPKRLQRLWRASDRSRG